MILNNIKYGNIIIPTLAEFGKGDIAVANAKNDTHVVIIFQNQTPREIGSTGDILKGQSTDDINPQIIMIFDDENSIDVVIRKLQSAQDELHEILIKP